MSHIVDELKISGAAAMRLLESLQRGASQMGRKASSLNLQVSGISWKRSPFRLMKLAACLFFSLFSLQLLAQKVMLRGQVTDESGGFVPGAKVALTSADGKQQTAVAGTADGSYLFSELTPGTFIVRASAPNLMLKQPLKISLKQATQTLNLILIVAAENQQLNVEDNAVPAIGIEASSNASAIILRGNDLDALSDNPDDLAADLQALAGPSAGPNGGSIFIDGFSGGELPPKSSIREIRINQNPFSPEYDKLGFGRIEIFTKPGSDRFRGSLGYNFANDALNSRNAYSAQKAPFHLHEMSGTLSGPINKRSSFNLTTVQEWVDNGSVINGVTLDSQLRTNPFNGILVASLLRTIVTPRFDFQLNTNNTVTVRYSFNRDEVTNAGVGALNLADRGYHNVAGSHTLQVVENAVLGARTINETRFQLFRPKTVAEANSSGAALQVLGAFNGGGNPLGRSEDTQTSYELQNYTSVVHGAHMWRFGVRVRASNDTSISPQNFGGTFTFSGGPAPQLDARNNPVLDAAGKVVLVNISSIENYRRTLLFQQAGLTASRVRQLGGGASQFSIGAGNARISGSQTDMGIFVGDQWKVRPNFSLDYGLRYETQSNLSDWRDLAPRIGIAWAPGKSSGKAAPKNVIRAGFGTFYDRFSLSHTLAAQRYNGLVQQQYLIANPDFFPQVPSASALPGPIPSSTIQQISSSLRAPYLLQSAIGFERQLPKNTTLAITYANSHGLHLLRSQNINAPLAGTYLSGVAGSGVFPLGRSGQALLMESSGLYNQNQLIFNVNTKVNRNVSLVGSYMFNSAKSNTDGLGTIPGSPYSMVGEYGPASTDIRHRASLSGTVTVKWGIRFNPLFTVNSGPPFDITAGRDLYGDGLFNGRPGFATDAAKAGVVSTSYGLLDPNPVAGQRLVSRNYGRGPGQIMLNMRIGRTFMFGTAREGGGVVAVAGGSAAGGGARPTPGTSPFSTGAAGQASTAAPKRYGLAISMQIRNLTNHNNPGPIIGNMTSPLFGMANQPAGSGNGIFSESANNRRLELQTRFTF